MGFQRWAWPFIVAFALVPPLLVCAFGLSKNVALAIVGYAVLFVGAPLEVMRRLNKLKDEERRR